MANQLKFRPHNNCEHLCLRIYFCKSGDYRYDYNMGLDASDGDVGAIVFRVSDGRIMQVADFFKPTRKRSVRAAIRWLNRQKKRLESH